MQTVPIQAIPNQQFSVVLDDSQWNITIKTTNDATAMSVTRDNVLIIENTRVVPGVPIIPARYQEAGNFLLITKSGELADYTKFGVTQSLLYITADELAVLRADVAPPITAAYFDPIAALPLRFAPQGYTL